MQDFTIEDLLADEIAISNNSDLLPAISPQIGDIYSLFKTQVALSPESIALIYGNNCLSYQELDNQVNLLAATIAPDLPQTETMVLVCLPRSSNLLIAMLAIFKAGGVYVPVDANYPQERINYILKDTDAPLIITTSATMDCLGNYEGKIITLDKIAIQSLNNMEASAIKINSNQLAYVIYSSGTTGAPKGILVEHKAICNKLFALQKTFQLAASDVVLHHTTPSFDVSIEELCWPLIIGAKIVIASPDIHHDFNQFMQLMLYHKITILDCVPAVLYMLLQQANIDSLSSLKTIFVGGEALTGRLLGEYQRKLNIPLYNMYGPTEACISATSFNCNDYFSADLEVIVPIGKALPNTQILILDEKLCAVSSGTRGEIYIGGNSLARGYLNQLELTQQAFILSSSNEIVYKTGDIGSQLADGTLLFHGRVDNQIKLRGFRIELEEIERVLCKNDKVKNAVVACIGETEIDKKLVAFIEVDSSDNNDILENIKQIAKKYLPNYMVPQEYNFIDQFAYLINGKVDRKTVINQYHQTKDESKIAISSPLTDTEEKLIKIWSKILKVDNINREDDFFELGGHSLLATQLTANINSVFRINCPLRILFEYSTLKDCACHLDNFYLVNQYLDDINYIKPLPVLVIDLDNRYQEFPLTDIQQAYLIGRSNDYSLGNVSANGYSEYDFEKIDLLKLELAWNSIIKRHEALRLIFTESGHQKILSQVPYFTIKINDLRNFSDSEQISKLQTTRDFLAHRILPADQWPLFDIQATLLNNTTRIHLNFDSLNVDAWSNKIIFEEWSQLYFDPNYVLPTLNISFRDYVIYEQQLKKSSAYLQHQKYWLDRLPSFPNAPALSKARQESDIVSPRFTRVSHQVTNDYWKKFQNITRKNNITPTAGLLAIFAEILAHWSKSKLFSINLTIFNRLPVHDQINLIAGDFTSIILLEVDFSVIKNNIKTNFLNRARQLQERLWLDLDHRLFSGVEMQREYSKFHQNYGDSSLASVVFTCVLTGGKDEKTTPSAIQRLNPLEVFTITQTPQVGVDSKVYLQDNNLIIEWDYVDNLFPTEMISNMHKAYYELFYQLSNTETSWLEYSFDLRPEEQKLKHVFMNDNDFHYPLKPLHELFLQQEKIRPTALAIVSSTESLTYESLASLSKGLASRLFDLNIKPNNLIAVIIDKSIHQLISCLGIMMSGAAYLPIDPTLPILRIEELLIKGKVKCILTQEKYQGLLQNLSLVNKLGERCLIAIDKPENIQNFYKLALATTLPKVQLADLAYVIFTSGSTGNPKGVMISHQSCANTILDINSRYHVSATDKIFALSNLNFDLSVYDFFGMLAAGGTIVIPSSTQAKDPAVWHELLVQHAVTIWNSVPMLLQLLVSELDGKNNSNLLDNKIRLMLLSGDKIPLTLPDKVKSLLNSTNNIEIISLGGATESAIWSIAYPIKHIDPEWKTIPYGRALGNQKFYVLNKDLEHCPDWVVGELYISGTGVALGYWRETELTAQRFLDYPYGNEKIYKTGDLGRYLPDGNIEFLGRDDYQVKISGHRIEFGEIEATLNKHPNVLQTVIDIIEHKEKYKSLIAYCTLKNPSPNDILIDSLRAYLSDRLPHYMIPSYFVILDTIPLSPNGKVDKKALPVPDTQPRILSIPYQAATTALEQRLCELWATLLAVEKVGIHDNFFHLGGNSLLAMRMVSQVRRQESVTLELKALFESPTIAGLIKTHLQQAGADILQATEITLLDAQQRQQFLPLSFAQQRLWFLEHILPADMGVYNIPLQLKLEGELNELALEKALTAIINRHEILRCVFSQDDKGEARQQIDAPVGFTLKVINLSTATDQAAQIKNIIQDEASRQFDLTSSPLLRSSLLRLSEREFILLLTLHHIAADGWSLGILSHELSIFYNAYCHEQVAQLPILSIQYVDFAYWQRNWLQGERLEHQLTYWQKQLADIPELLSLPGKGPRPKEPSYHGAEHRHVLPEKLVKDLKSLCAQEEVTLFMLLLTALQILLHRYSGQDDIIVGTPIANRHYAGVEGLIGLFINTLALRTRFDGNPVVTNLLAQVKQTALAAYAHQDVPFEQLVDHLQINRDISRHPVFQVMFILQEGKGWELNLNGLSTKPVLTEGQIAKFDLTLHLQTSTNGVELCWEYATDLYEGWQIAQLSGHYEKVLTEIVANPEQRIGEIELLTAAEYQRQVIDWNATEQTYPHDKCLHELIEEQVRRTPQAIAVSYEHQELSYMALNEKANQLAHYLRKEGVTAGSLVAVCLERSLALVIALLAIQKAGGAYVPMDPDYPQSRLLYMLKDTGAELVLTQAITSKKLADYPGKCILLDKEPHLYVNESCDNPVNVASPDDLIYVIYTSGSTGKPKGVMIQHRSVVNLLWSKELKNHVTADSVVMALTNITFDIAGLEIYLPLVQGAKIILAPRIITQDAQLLVNFINENSPTLIQTTPMLWKMITAAGWDPEQKISIFCGGEALSQELARKLFNRSKSITNLYGPTETTIWSGITQIKEPLSTALTNPLANTKIYILDQNLQPVPKGVAGDIYIAGVGLAQGYLHQPDLTKEKFFLHKFKNFSIRIYKTGDIGKFNVDTNIEYLSRKDDQVKFNGIRIELGEIETCIKQHSLVDEAIALVKNQGVAPQLVLYYVTDTLSPEKARQYLKNWLPATMLPSQFIPLTELKYTPHGKIDKKALLTYEGKINTLLQTVPITRIEFNLLKIWQEFLGLQQINMTDDFFEMGGNSLLAIQLALKIAAEFKVKISVANIFHFKTIKEQAEYLTDDSKQADLFPQTIVALNKPNKKPPLFLVHPAGGLAFTYLKLIQFLPNITLYGINSPHLHAKVTQLTTLEETASYYINEMQNIAPHGPYYLGGWSAGGVIAFEMARQLMIKGHEIINVILIDSFNVSQLGDDFVKENEDFNEQVLQQGFDPTSQLGQILKQELERSTVLLSQYFPKLYNGKVSLLKADIQKHPQRCDSSNGWQSVATKLKIYSIPGAHGELFDTSYIKTTALEIEKLITTT
jgi:amino acid adenylation domain-containing protein